MGDIANFVKTEFKFEYFFKLSNFHYSFNMTTVYYIIQSPLSTDQCFFLLVDCDVSSEIVNSEEDLGFVMLVLEEAKLFANMLCKIFL